jgi:Cu-Zn family superoxide dismutase
MKSTKKFLSLSLATLMLLASVPTLGMDHATMNHTSQYDTAIQYVTQKGYMTGTDKGFEATGTVTRGTVYQVLYNLAGKPSVKTTSSFTDVNKQWYATAVSWAENIGLITGKGQFEGNQKVTHQELYKIFADYAKLNGLNTTNGLQIAGYTDGTAASETAKRSELAQMLLNYNNLKQTSANSVNSTLSVTATAAAHAQFTGGETYPNLNGEVLFYPAEGGTLVVARVNGLPSDGFYALHIHEKQHEHDTQGESPFLKAGGHYNPDSTEHPNHAGDLPVLLSNNGEAFLVTFTDNFNVEDLKDRSVMIHAKPDDYRSQPAGDSGTRIASANIELVDNVAKTSTADPTTLLKLAGTPAASAEFTGGDAYPTLNGQANFYAVSGGTLVLVHVNNLPSDGFYALHIHETQHEHDTQGDTPFLKAGGHYNPDGAEHPNHAGDLPVLLSNKGEAFLAVYTTRFTPEEVKNRSVMIHAKPDDYRSQPAGDSGARIASANIQ